VPTTLKAVTVACQEAASDPCYLAEIIGHGLGWSG